MSKHSYPFLLNIGFNKFLPYNTIIGIFNIRNFDEITEKPMIKQKIILNENKAVKSYVYCKGSYLIGSPIESKTLKMRYEKFQNEINGLSNNKGLYVKVN